MDSDGATAKADLGRPSTSRYRRLRGDTPSRIPARILPCRRRRQQLLSDQVFLLLLIFFLNFREVKNSNSLYPETTRRERRERREKEREGAQIGASIEKEGEPVQSGVAPPGSLSSSVRPQPPSVRLRPLPFARFSLRHFIE